MGRLSSTPTIVAAGAGNMAPLGESSFVSGFAFGHTDAGQPLVARALQYVVTSGYVEALNLRVKEGRAIASADESSPIEAMLVNEAFVRAYITDGRGGWTSIQGTARQTRNDDRDSRRRR